jgi:hypothetical protein
MADPGSKWPKKGDKPFALSSRDRASLEAFAMPSEEAYALGFQVAADMIVTGAEGEDLSPDVLFFPLAYLYRHHLELMLKQLIGLGVRAGAVEAPSDSRSEPCPACGHRELPKDWRWDHNLHKLWNKAKLLIRRVWPDSPVDDLKAVERVLQHFNELDRTGQAFRYPRDKQGKPHPQSAPRQIDLDNLRSVVAGVSRFLDAAYAGIYDSDPGPP